MNKTIKTEEETYKVANLRLIGPEVITDENLQLVRDWVTELRSGNKEQGKAQLHGVGSDGTEFFCCLGVLCSLAPDVVKTAHQSVERIDGYLYDQAGAYLPLSLAIRLEIEPNPQVVDISNNQYTSLGLLNDEGATFEQIAQIIEQSWLGETA